MRIYIHAKDPCPFAFKAKTWFDALGLPYTEFLYNDLADRQEMYRTLSERFGRECKTVPQIVVEEDGRETLIGGYTDLLKSDWARTLKARFKPNAAA